MTGRKADPNRPPGKQAYIYVKSGTRTRIKTYGTLGSTFDSVLNMLMDFWDQEHEKRSVPGNASPRGEAETMIATEG